VVWYNGATETMEEYLNISKRAKALYQEKVLIVLSDATPDWIRTSDELTEIQ